MLLFLSCGIISSVTRSDNRGSTEAEVGPGSAIPRAVSDGELRSATVCRRSAGGDWTQVLCVCACVPQYHQQPH